MGPSANKNVLIRDMEEDTEMAVREQRRNWCSAVISQGMPGDGTNWKGQTWCQEKYGYHWQLDL